VNAKFVGVFVTQGVVC